MRASLSGGAAVAVMLLPFVAGCTLVGASGTARAGDTPHPPEATDPDRAPTPRAGRAPGAGGVDPGAGEPGAAGRGRTAPGHGEPMPRMEFKSRYGNPESYRQGGQTYHVLPTSAGYVADGWASWYGEDFHGRRTSSGEPYDMVAFTAAHRTLPLPTYVRVTSLENGRQVIVRVNDRGPFHDVERRIIDLSRAAAERLGILGTGVARVRIEALDPPARDRPPDLRRDLPHR